MKSILAFQYILKNYKFDYVIRTNISTFWNLNKLNRVLTKLPNKKCVAGYWGPKLIIFIIQLI